MSDLGKAKILQEIRTAEEKVRSMSKEAEERRKQLQAEGKRLALQKTDAAETALAKKLETDATEAQERASLRRKRLLEEGQKTAGALTADARKRMREAKGFVLNEFERAADA